MRERRSILTCLLIAIFGTTVLLGGTGCAVRQVHNSQETMRIGRAGITVLVDSTVRISVAGAPAAVSVPENAMIAVDMLETAKSALRTKGYAVSDASLLSVGAQLPAAEEVEVRMPAGTFGSPGAYGKPFIVRPEAVEPARATKLNELFLWSRSGEGTAPKGSLDIQQTAGLLLITCAGGNKLGLSPSADKNVSIASFKPGVDPGADAWSEVLLVALDRMTGKIVWQERGSVSAFTPDAVADEVRRLVEALPAAK